MSIVMTFILQRNIKLYWLFQQWMGRYTNDFLDLLDVLQFNLACFIPLIVTIIKEDNIQLHTLVSFGHLSSTHPAFLPTLVLAGPTIWDMSSPNGKRNSSELEDSTSSLSSLVLPQPSPTPSFPTSLPGLPYTQQTLECWRDFVPRKKFCPLEVLYS